MSADGERTESLSPYRSLAASLRLGDPTDEVRVKFLALVSVITVTRFATVILELAAEGLSREVLQHFVDWAGTLSQRADVSGMSDSPGHPLREFRRENEALERQVELCCAAMQGLGSAETFGRARTALTELSAVDNHYRRQEFLLFARMELHGIERPGRILWAAHDEIRQWLKYLDLQFASSEFSADRLSLLADSVVGPLLDDVRWMIFLEERVLLPMARDVLDAADWAIIRKYSPEIGWCLIEPELGDSDGPPVEHAVLPSGLPKLSLPTGVLDVGVLVSIHARLPVDITFVDAEDRVRYFTKGSQPVFYRSEANLGRDVRCCHPPRSVHYVDQILSDFKAGRETSAQFWKHMGHRFIHIRFVALHDANGDYRGTLEIAQDITPMRALEGEQLQLRYDRNT